jgi:hypothetical protein
MIDDDPRETSTSRINNEMMNPGGFIDWGDDDDEADGRITDIEDESSCVLVDSGSKPTATAIYPPIVYFYDLPH